MKVKSSIKRMCGFCQIIRRGKILYVRCQKNNRHKQRQGFHTLNQNFKLGDKRYCECSFSSSHIITSNDLNLDMTFEHKEECKKNINDEIDSNKNKMI
jgi:ribosomal protein L36